MAKKKTPQEGKKFDNPNVMGLHAEVLEQPITETLELNYMPYAMSVIVSRAIPEILPPEAAVHHVRHGAADQGADQVGQRGGGHHEAQPPRRCGHL